MDSDLISKKELLEHTGISYGALYRYKRKNLIPDEWFIRKSTFTGQETFFPRERIIDRIAQIQALKEDVSLDDMTHVLSADVPRDITCDRETLLSLISAPLRPLLDKYGLEAAVPFTPLLAVSTADAALKTGQVALAECEQILQVILDIEAPQKGDRLLCYRSSGVLFCLVASGAVKTAGGLSPVLDMSLPERVAAMKCMLREANTCKT